MASALEDVSKFSRAESDAGASDDNHSFVEMTQAPIHHSRSTLWAVILGVIIGAACRSESPINITIVGPSDNLRVVISGQTPPGRPGPESVVNIQVSNSDGVVVAPFEVYRSDWMDRGFTDIFPAQAWPLDNAIQFVGRAPATSSRTDTIELDNQAGRSLRCIQIDSGDYVTGDLILLFEVPPGRPGSLHITNSADAVSCFNVKIRGETGNTIVGRRACFQRSERERSRIYTVTLKSESIVIEERSD